MRSSNTFQPLKDLVVLDLSRLYPGPLCSWMLAGLGADVIKLELPQKPDPTRAVPPLKNGKARFFEMLNQGKRSLALDFFQPSGRDILRQLLPKTDILLEGFRPGVMDSVGLGYASCSEVAPQLIYTSLTGYGQDGPFAQKAGHDLNYCAEAGLLDVTGLADGPPVVPGAQIADTAGGAYQAVMGILVALQARHASGQGQHVDIAMLEGLMPLMALQFAQHEQAQPPTRGKAMLDGGAPCYGIFRCGDDQYVALGALEPKFWKAFCDMVDHQEWIPRQFATGADRQQLLAEMATVFGQKPRELWLKLAESFECCLSPILAIDELCDHPQLQHRGWIDPRSGTPRLQVPMKFSAGSMPTLGQAPTLGQHTRAILSQFAIDTATISRLEEEGVCYESSADNP